MRAVESIKLEINVPIKMRDGVILYADVWRPDNKAKCPAILLRTPYDKKMQYPVRAGYTNPQRFARAGYAVVIQDVRGTGDSEGTAHYWHQEYEDGYDSVEGVAALPWCSGKIGMFGISYFGYTQWAAAVSKPPHLAAICPVMCGTNFRSFPQTNKHDVFRLGVHMGWSSHQILGELFRRNLPPAELFGQLDKLMTLIDNSKEEVKYLPMNASPMAKFIDKYGMQPAFKEIAENISDEKHFHYIEKQIDLKKISVPCFHVGGWYDQDFTASILDNFNFLQKKAATAAARNNQKLIIGPWIHSHEMMNIVGEVDFGMRSSGPVQDIAGKHISWFDHWLKGEENALSKESNIKIFVMGRNVWRDENEWPLARTQYTPYYFHSKGKANTRSGDGMVNAKKPAKESADTFAYDPADPAPSNDFQGAWDQQYVEDRKDVLVYSSGVLKSDLEVTGPVAVHLFASSSAVDTDFSGKLVDVWPDGKAYNVLDGIMRARYRKSVAEKELLEPGKVYPFTIDLGSTSIVFKAGHQLRVEISSAYFPKWERNLNTGNDPATDTEMKTATQKILHNAEYPSHILLPVIPGVGFAG